MIAANRVFYRKVYCENYDTIGASPFAVLIGDYEFGKQPQDVHLLKWLSQVAASAHAPFIAAAAPSLFNVDRFSAMTESVNVSKIFRSPDYTLWKSFRESDTSRYVGLCLPRVLMRNVYDGADDEDFCYREEVNSAGQEAYLWGNPAYLLASCLIGAFMDRGWCGSILGVEGGGYLSGLPYHIVKSNAGGWALAGPCEVGLTNDQEEGLARLGFIPVTHYKGTDAIVFLSAPSCRRADPNRRWDRRLEPRPVAPRSRDLALRPLHQSDPGRQTWGRLEPGRTSGLPRGLDLWL